MSPKFGFSLDSRTAKHTFKRYALAVCMFRSNSNAVFSIPAERGHDSIVILK